MTNSTEAINKLLQTNMAAAQKYAELALDEGGLLFRTFAHSMRDACELGEQEYRHFWSGDSGQPLDYLPEMMQRRLDFAAAMTKSYLDGGMQFYGALQRIASEQIPAMQKSMQEAINAAVKPPRS